MMARRALFALLVAAVTAGLLALAWRTLSPGGWSVLEAVILLAFGLNAPWIALAAATGIAGFVIRMTVRDPSAFVLPALRGLDADASIRLRTVIAVCVRQEDMRAVLPPLERLLRDLGSLGVGDRFALAILSDTQAGPAAEAEAAAVSVVAARNPPGAVRYRRRTDNAGYKAGNVIDFLDHHAEGVDLMLSLDADSRVTAPMLLRMVRILQADPGTALVQACIAGEGADAPFPRIFGLGHRHSSRTWATGQGWWQGDQGPYWGHNALVRIAPFRTHCRLDLLPDGRHILSHDHVEAARLHGAGCGVRVLPEDFGSFDSHPPNLPTYLARDGRWAAGNWQYRFLLRRRDLGAIGRLQLLQAIAHYALTPAWFALLPLAALNAATGGADGTPRGTLLLWLAAGWFALHAPKLGGYVEALVHPREVCNRAGTRQAMAGCMLREMVFTQLFDPIVAFDKTVAMLRLAAGRAPAWPAQQRSAVAISWGDAMRRFAPHTLLGALLLGVAALGSGFALLVMLPFAAGLLLAVPFAVLTARPDYARSPGFAATAGSVVR